MYLSIYNQTKNIQTRGLKNILSVIDSDLSDCLACSQQHVYMSACIKYVSVLHLLLLYWGVCVQFPDEDVSDKRDGSLWAICWTLTNTLNYCQNASEISIKESTNRADNAC